MLRTVGWALRLLLVVCASLACARNPTKLPENAAAPVAIDAALGTSVVKAGASQHLIARVGLSTEKKTSTSRPPVNLALLVDTSGSMEGRAIQDARAASLALLESLAKEDRLAVVTFNSKADVLLPSTRIDDADMKDLRAKIGAMKAQGTTDMVQGLSLALSEVERNLIQSGVNRVVLLGDGVPNDDRAIDGFVARANNQGISVTTLGLGNDYDEMLMGRIAQRSGGKFSYIEDSSKVAAFFKEEVVRLHKVVARNAVLEIHPGPGVVVEDVVGRPMQRADRTVSVLLGDLTLGEHHELVVELAANPTKDGSTLEAFDAVLRWQDAVGGAQHEESVFVGAKATADEAKVTGSKNATVTDAFARAKDAAATLKKLEEHRKQSNNNAKAPSPSPADGPFDDGKARMGGAGAAPAAASPPKRMSAEEVRRAHQDAIQNFQAY